jgi:ribosomal protein S18 acetylase RimI-like enzyme
MECCRARARAPVGRREGAAVGLAPLPRSSEERPHGDVALRPATQADVPALTDLARAAYSRYVARLGGPPRPMTDDYADVVRRSRVTIAERRGEVVGVAVLDITAEGFVVDNVAVDPRHQGTGVGRALLENAEGEARRAGFASIYLYTHERMTENLALYSRVGYVEYDRRLHGDACLVYLRKELAHVAADPSASGT